uniref:IGFBP N-terminal domain-containing protein n=1 Tax=Oncorhynchus tshawytscha TaxID=74940 RepID=A0AAZ3SMT8_ONCTS
METCYRTLWMTVVLALITRRSAAVGPVIRCEPCDAGARLLCKPLPKDCTERVRETGCGCCMTCALAFGQPCGVYTGRCGSGMTCQQQPGETKPLQALLEGRGQCAIATIKRSTAALPAVNEIQENVGGTQEEEQNTTAPVIQAPQALFSTSRPPVGPPRLPHHPSLLHPVKAVVIHREQLKRARSYKMEELPGAHSTDQQNFSLESKQEPEYVSTRSTVLLSLGTVFQKMFSSSSFFALGFGVFLLPSPPPLSLLPIFSVFWCFSPPFSSSLPLSSPFSLGFGVFLLPSPPLSLLPIFSRFWCFSPSFSSSLSLLPVFSRFWCFSPPFSSSLSLSLSPPRFL